MNCKSYFLIVLFFMMSCNFLDEECDCLGPTTKDIVKINIVDINGDNNKFLCLGENHQIIPGTYKLIFKDNDKLYIMNFDGSEKKYFATAPKAQTNLWFNMTLSNDNQYIAFGSRSDVAYDIYIAKLDGTILENLTNSTDKWEDQPSFSPDGTKIVYYENIYVSSTQHNWAAYGLGEIDINGNNYKQFYKDSLYSYSPQYSKDGKSIVYFRNSIKNGQELYIVNANNYEIIEKIELEISHTFIKPTFIDEKKLIYSNEKTELHILNLDTKEKQIIFSGDLGDYISVSEDFTKIISINNGIQIIDLISKEINKILTETDLQLREPKLSYDNQKIIYVTYESEEVNK